MKLRRGEADVGALVRWTAASTSESELGVVSAVGRRQLSVDFDDGQTRNFVVEAAPLERVELKGQVVRRSTGEAGVIVDGPTGMPPVWRVAFLGASGNFLTKTVPESDLRPYVATSPAARIKSGQTAGPSKANLALVSRWYDIENRTNELVSLGQARVDLKPYQVSVVHRVITDYPHRFLLCDEVGLGKTIEAGMILKELRARGHARRTLVIAPPNLVRQWQFELKTKFNETFSILNSQTIAYLKSTGFEGNPFTWNDSVVVSSAWITYSDDLAKLVAQVDWDMVILDEAHHARSHRYGNRVETTRLYRLMRELSSPSQFSKRALLMLTATPMQLHAQELYSLVEMLDPALFPSVEHFQEHQRRLPGLNHLVDDLRKYGFPTPMEAQADTVRRVAEWLSIDRELALKRLSAGPSEIETVCDDLSKEHLLSEVLIRNRKSVVGGFMPRQAHRWEVELTEEEATALEAVQAYVLGGWDRARRTSDNSVGFVMTIFQKLMASSIWALRQSLLARRERLAGHDVARVDPRRAEERLDDDERALGAVVSATGDDLEITELGVLVEKLSSIKVDSKARVLVDQLSTLFANTHSLTENGAEPARAWNQKVLIFTEFRETQNYLERLLAEQGWSVHLFHGQMPAVAKDASVAGFRDGTGPQVLISTEAGGEGRNFQFCHILVNYDLPWNPMRVEQRIGRVDRIGQERVVQIFNLWVKGTIEERVLDVLEKRINIFADTVGGLDPILGDTERDLRKVLQLQRHDQERALQALGEQLEEQVRQAREAEAKLRDFIMDTKSYSREIAERVTGHVSPISAEDQERFVTHLLADVRTWIGPVTNGEREIVFHEPFISDFKEFSKDGIKRRIVFRPEEVRDAEHVEFFAFGHPIVNALLQRTLEENYEGNAASRRIPADEDLPEVTGWLCNFVISVPGLKKIEELHPMFVTDDLEIDEELGWKLVRRAADFRRSEQPISADELHAESLDAALEQAETRVRALATFLQERIREQSVRQADRERSKLRGFFDYRERAAEDRLASTKATLERLEASANPDDQKIVPVWRANLERDERLIEELVRERNGRLGEIDQRLNPVADWLLASLVRVEIFAYS